jgi:hypothetical protein
VVGILSAEKVVPHVAEKENPLIPPLLVVVVVVVVVQNGVQELDRVLGGLSAAGHPHEEHQQEGNVNLLHGQPHLLLHLQQQLLHPEKPLFVVEDVAM